MQSFFFFFGRIDYAVISKENKMFNSVKENKDYGMGGD